MFMYSLVNQHIREMSSPLTENRFESKYNWRMKKQVSKGNGSLRDNSALLFRISMNISINIEK